MKKTLTVVTILAALAWCQTSYGMGRVLIYKGTIKAAKTVVDVNDTNNPASTTIKAYFALNIYNTHDSSYGLVLDSSAVIYNPKTKYYKVIPDVFSADPYDPCKVVVMSFSAEDPEGDITFNVTGGKGRLTKYTDDTSYTKDYIVTKFKGAGVVNNYDLFDPDDTYSGSVTVTMTLDSCWTRYSNPGVYSNIDDCMSDIVAELTYKGGWTNWPDLSP
jgi:hypothetical protein